MRVSLQSPSQAAAQDVTRPDWSSPGRGSRQARHWPGGKGRPTSCRLRLRAFNLFSPVPLARATPPHLTPAQLSPPRRNLTGPVDHHRSPSIPCDTRRYPDLPTSVTCLVETRWAPTSHPPARPPAPRSVAASAQNRTGQPGSHRDLDGRGKQLSGCSDWIGSWRPSGRAAPLGDRLRARLNRGPGQDRGRTPSVGPQGLVS
jgi:hypothetical protein